MEYIGVGVSWSHGVGVIGTQQLNASTHKHIHKSTFFGSHSAPTSEI